MNIKQLNIYAIFFGDAEKFSLNHRFLIATTFCGWFFSFVSLFVNIFMDYGFILILINTIFSILFLIIYLLARIYQRHRVLVIPTVIIIYFISIYIWILTEGTRGGGQYIFFPALCSSLFLVNTRGKIILLFVYISSLVSLFIIEYYHIFNIVLYQTAFDRLFDMSFTFIVSMIFTAAAFLIVVKSYNDSQQIILLRNDEIEKELEVARLIQKKLLPVSFYDSKEITIYTTFLPMDKVGGDFFDYNIDNNMINIFIADVSGYGIPGAFLALITKTIMNNLNKNNIATNHTLYQMNNELCNYTLMGNFVAFFYCIYNMQDRILRYSSAGHFPPIVFRPGTNEFFDLTAKGGLLGWKKNVDFEEKSIQLQQLDRVVIYTDGIIECENENRIQYGENKFKEFIKMNYMLSPDNFSRMLINELKKFSKREFFDDDVSLVYIEVK